MPRPSTVDKLPLEVRGAIGELRQQGVTLDRILEHLRALGADVSRSALGRHVKSMAVVGERLRRSREVAETLVRELGDAPASRTAQLNIELLHGTIFDLFDKAGDGEAVDQGGQAALQGNPEGVMLLAKAVDHLTKASKTDVQFIMQVEQRAADKARKAAAEAVERVGRAEGISRQTLNAIKAGVFGVAAP